MATATRCTTLVAGFGRPGMRDLDFGRQVVRYLEGLAWPEGVVVEDLSYSAPLVLGRLHELEPARLVLVGAVGRGLGPPGQVRRRRLEPDVAEPGDVHRYLAESLEGVADLDHTLAVARHWGGLPADTVVIEVEPADCSFGPGFSEELGATIDRLVAMLRAELGLPAEPEELALDLSALALEGAVAGQRPVAGAPARPGEEQLALGLVELADRAHEHSQRLRARSHRRLAVGDEALAAAGLEVALRSQPWGIKLDHGSDWHDVIALGDGWFGLAMGDAPGRGIEATATMEELRAAMRAYAVAERGRPAEVLGLLDRLVRATGVGTGATLAYLALHPDSGKVRLANAGHCPPLRLGGPCGDCFLVGGRSEPLGAGVTRRPEVTYVLPPAATLVLYTDGLVQSRSRDLGDGLRTLRLAAAAAAPEPLDVLCDEVVAACAQGLDRDDDLSVLGVRLSPRLRR